MFRRQDAGRVQVRLGSTPFLVLSAALPLALFLCPRQPSKREPLWTGMLSATGQQDEFHITFRGRAPGVSWQEPGRETAVLQVSVDGRYDQHVFLAAGETPAEYGFIAGPLSPGEHRLQIDWRRDWTPGLNQTPELGDLTVEPLPKSDPGVEPVLRAPSIYLRPDTIGRFSDVPLLLYWEREDAPGRAKVTYTLVLSNEDGGTNTERLMARWGRTTDIEWCYEYDRSSGTLEETYQGRDHEKMQFQGAYDGLHPRLFDASRNNIFSDRPAGSETVRVRLFPIYQDLKGRTRESVMDRYPWVYPLMAGEMVREGKIEKTGDPESACVSDLRNYAYVEVCARQRGTELRFEARVSGGEWYSSDHGDAKARVERSGCFRSSIELPQGTAPAQLSALRVECVEKPLEGGAKPVTDPEAALESIGPVFMLQENYYPSSPVKLRAGPPAVLKPGQSLEFEVGR